MYREKDWEQLHKNAASNTEQVLEATPHKTAAIRPPTMKTIKVRWTRHAEHCYRSKDELISDILPWTPSHGRPKTRRPARTYIQQLCTDTGYDLEDLLGAMDDWDRWQEGLGRSVLAARYDDFKQFSLVLVKFFVYTQLNVKTVLF